MIAKLRRISQALARFDVNREAQIIFGQSADDLVKLNTDQLLQGKDSTGDFITPDYFYDSYKAEKIKKNPKAGGHVDLKYNGDFHDGIFVDVDSRGITIDSSDGKTPSLESKYGKEIFGLTPESRRKFIAETLRPGLLNALKKELYAA